MTTAEIYADKIFDSSKALGYINRRLYTDVDSFAVLELSKDGKTALLQEVERPLAKCWDPEVSKKNGVPDGLTTIGKPFNARFTYGKWRFTEQNGIKTILGSRIDPDCRYYYDLNF